MKPWKEIELVEYSKAEELLHTLTHGAGLVLSACIVTFCFVPSVRSGDVLRIVCASLYFFGTTIMFLTSALYHGTKPSDRKKLLRLLDHCMIFFAVAGTATGCVPPVKELVGTVPAVLMTVCAWLGAISGLVFTFLSFEKTKALQMIMYIGTAAVCAAVGGKTFSVLPRGAFHCFLIGSACLLLGAVLYGIGKRKRWFHAIFHIFIDIGLTVFFIGIQKYCF